MGSAGKEELVCRNPALGLHAALADNYNGSHLPRACRARLRSREDMGSDPSTPHQL